MEKQDIEEAIVAPPIDASIEALIRLAVREDMASGAGTGDRTGDLALPAELRCRARVVARCAGVIAGGFLAARIFAEYGAGITVKLQAADATAVQAGAAVAEIEGPARAILSAERVVLNFLGHLSGIATLTRAYVRAVDEAVPDAARRPVICDTRKTTPGFRTLDKYAVRCGGGVNHRMGLNDGVMLKDNHLAALRERLGKGLTLAELSAEIRARLEPTIPLWLEVDTLEQLRAALPVGDVRGADIILLDNFTPEQLRAAVELRNEHQSKIKDRKSKISLEASGGVTLANIAELARTGVDRISIGALTHSAPVLDLSLELV